MTVAPRKRATTLTIAPPAEVSLIKEHLAGSLGVEKAEALVTDTLTSFGQPTEGMLPAVVVEALLTALSAQDGLVGLAAKVTRQMLRNNIAPISRR